MTRKLAADDMAWGGGGRGRGWSSAPDTIGMSAPFGVGSE